MVTQNIAPPNEVTLSVLWLGKGATQTDAMPIGSGTVIDVDGAEYIATAYHVFQRENRPLVREENLWKPSNAELVAFDEVLDVAVLKCPTKLRSDNLTSALAQGIAGLVLGTPGLALGFPDVVDIELNRHVLEHISEADGRPVPFPTLALFYVGQSGFSGQTGELYCSGYTNAGYSGGVLAFPIHRTSQWALGAMITGFPKLWRPVQFPPGSILEAEGVAKSQEHMGIIKAITMNEIEAIVREGRHRSI